MKHQGLWQTIGTLSLIVTLFFVSANALAAAPTTNPSGKKAEVSTTKIPPLLLSLSPYRELNKTKGDIFIKAELWALQPTTACFYPENPEANFAVDVYRAGYGNIQIQPNVVQLDRKALGQIKRVDLKAGQVYYVLFNLKKMVQLPPGMWESGEYRVQAKYFLCGKTEKDEVAIPSRGPLHLLLLD